MQQGLIGSEDEELQKRIQQMAKANQLPNQPIFADAGNALKPVVAQEGVDLPEQLPQTLEGEGGEGIAPKAEGGMSYGVAKAGIDTVAGVVNAYMQGKFMDKENKRKVEAEAESMKARGRATATMGAEAQKAGALSDLMGIYRSQYARKLT